MNFDRIKAAQAFLSSDVSLIYRQLKQLQVEAGPLQEQLEGVNLEHVAKVISLYEEDLKQLKHQVEYIKRLEEETKSKLEMNSEEKKKMEAASLFYQSLLDKLTGTYLDSLSGLLSSVYAAVYQDDRKRVVLTMEDYRKRKVIRLNIVNRVNGRDYKEDISEDGGSAAIIMGSVIAMYFIMVAGLPRIIFFDESFSALHNQSLHGFMPFLQSFVEDMGFVFVIVSHDFYRLRPYLTKIYHVENGHYTLVDDMDEYVRKHMQEIEQVED